MVGQFACQSKAFSQLIPKSAAADFIGQLKPCQETIRLRGFSSEFRKFMDSSPTNITATGIMHERAKKLKKLE